jgi:S-disulfanyl-L-cysteine oxidoreductase SoxD
MYSSRCLLPVLVVLVTILATSGSGEEMVLGQALKPGLGQQIMNHSGSIVSPDGSGLPVGRGSVSEGKSIYAAKCAACHGVDGRQPGNQLAGGLGSLSTSRPLKTVGSFWPYATTLYDYISRAMPYDQEKSLSADETYAVTAFVLKLNGILGDEVFLDELSLPGVKMPNREGFIELAGPLR